MPHSIASIVKRQLLFSHNVSEGKEPQSRHVVVYSDRHHEHVWFTAVVYEPPDIPHKHGVHIGTDGLARSQLLLHCHDIVTLIHINHTCSFLSYFVGQIFTSILADECVLGYRLRGLKSEALVFGSKDCEFSSDAVLDDSVAAAEAALAVAVALIDGLVVRLGALLHDQVAGVRVRLAKPGHTLASLATAGKVHTVTSLDPLPALFIKWFWARDAAHHILQHHYIIISTW